MLNRLTASFIFVSALFIASFSYAAGIGANVEPLGNRKVSLALIDNMVFNKEYETDNDVTKNILDEKNEVYTKLSLGVTDFANVYGLLGAVSEAKFKLDWSDGTFNKLETNSGFLWGGGLGVTYSVEEMFFIGADTHFLTWDADVDSVDESGTRASNISGDYTYYEAQTAIYIGKHIDTMIDDTGISLVPYIGGVYHYSEYDLDTSYEAGGTSYNITMNDFQNDDKFGIVVGIDVIGKDVEFEDLFRLHIEARTISEEALTIGCSLKF